MRYNQGYISMGDSGMKHGAMLHMGGAKKLATFEVAFKGKRQIAEDTYEYTFEKPAAKGEKLSVRDILESYKSTKER